MTQSTDVADARAVADLLNRQRRWYEYNTGKVSLKSLPDIFSIESTNFCNIRCVMCPRGEPDIMTRSVGHMKTDVFRRVIDGWEFYTDPVWLHLFGEPLMNPQIFEQISYAKSAGIAKVGISTNATLLTAEKIDPLLESGLDTIMLCIDGNSKDTYEAIRKSPVFTYETVCANVRAFLDAARSKAGPKPHTVLSIIVMDETQGQLTTFESTWRAAGADEVVFKPFTTWGGQTEHRFSALAPFEQRVKLEEAGPAVREHPCLNLWTSIVVTWDGRVVPCCFDFDATVTMGNILDEDIGTIWNGPKYVEMRRAELAGRNGEALCRNCREAPGYARNDATPPPVGY